MNIPCLLHVPEHYATSRELSLGLQMFRASLPKNFFILPVADWSSRNLSNILAAESSPFFLLVREPAIMLPEDFAGIVDSLHRHPDCQALTLSRWFDFPEEIPFLSLRAYEKFSARLVKTTEQLLPLENGPLDLVLVRRTLLECVSGEDDPFQGILEKGKPGRLGNLCLHSFAHYYQHQREAFFPLLPESIHSLLDIGCASGQFAARVKQQYACRAVGLEQNPRQAGLAAEKLDKVVQEDVMHSSLEEKFDLVTCLDVLEHMQEPEELLAIIRERFLLRQGRLVLGIPNAGHWSLLEDLLAGRWDYLPAGLLCNTHLRFFTLHSIKKLLAENGFQIQDCRAVKLEMPAKLADAMQFLEKQGMDINTDSLNCLEYHIVAGK